MKFNVLHKDIKPLPTEEKLVVLALPLDIALKKIERAGYQVGTITFTRAPQGLERKTCRIVRQSIVEPKTINLVVDYSPWDEVNYLKEVEEEG